MNSRLLGLSGVELPSVYARLHAITLEHEQHKSLSLSCVCC